MRGRRGRVDDDGVYECDEAFASCSGRDTCRGGAQSSEAGHPDERHDDATPLTIDYCDSDNDVGCSHPPSVSLRGISIQTNLVLSG